MKLKWKVCGMRDPINIAQALLLAPDYLGFIFYRESPRYVGENWEGPLENIPDATKKVGVFVNQSIEEVTLLAGKYQLDYLQLHGDEQPEYCRELFEEGFAITKALSLKNGDDLKKLDAYKPWIRFFLFDTPSQQYGGTGKAFDWSLLSQYQHELPFFLSGGLSLDNLEDVNQLDDLNLWALDINSKFETQAGIKDISKLEEFKNQMQKL
jgi:phosphoribosylanthranilate isomerase